MSGNVWDVVSFYQSGELVPVRRRIKNDRGGLPSKGMTGVDVLEIRDFSVMFFPCLSALLMSKLTVS